MDYPIFLLIFFLIFLTYHTNSNRVSEAQPRPKSLTKVRPKIVDHQSPFHHCTSYQTNQVIFVDNNAIATNGMKIYLHK